MAGFAPFEWQIAWRYLRARRATGGVSVMTWISLIGIALAVFALVATLAVRAGLRAETLATILGANAHIEVFYQPITTETGRSSRVINDFDAVTQAIREVPGVTAAIPVVNANVIGNFGEYNAPVDLYGIRPADLAFYPSVAEPNEASGDRDALDTGIALGSGLARSLRVQVGDRVKIISPNGKRTPFGTSPRVSAFDVVYIFRSGHSFIDSTRAYLPMPEAQRFLNRDGAADQIEVMTEDPQNLRPLTGAIQDAAGPRAAVWTWQNRAGGFMRALRMQDNALYILLAILVLIATMNIVSGLIMLVKNKGRDIGILRTMGLSQASILRVFFLVGAAIGTLGTLIGVALGVLFATQIDTIYAFVDVITGSAKSQLEADGFFFPPAVLRPQDLLGAVALSLGLSYVITYFPARRAARMNPVEALRYE